MIRHELQLWEFAAKELDLGEHRYVERHLEDCPECVEQLAAVQVAREALELARASTPRLEWSRSDQRIGALVERRLAAQARGPWLARLGLGGLGLTAVAAGLALWLGQGPTALPAPELPRPGAPVAGWARVDSAEGLTRVGDGEVTGGTELRTGDVLRTSLAGRAFVHLPDESHVRVAGGSQVAMTRTEREDIALTLERGRVAVRASHLERRGFAVHSGGVTVHVVGTIFGVAREADAVEVAVTEGQVRVELSNGESVVVSPGERLRIDARTERTKRLALTGSLQRELTEVADLAQTTASIEQRAVVPAAGGAAPSQPPMVAAQGTPRTLPRLSPEEAKARRGTPPAGLDPAALGTLPAASPKSQPKPIVLEAPEDVWPSLGGGEIVRGVPPKREPAPASRPEDWASPPAPDADEWAAPPSSAGATGGGPGPRERPDARSDEWAPPPSSTGAAASRSSPLAAPDEWASLPPGSVSLVVEPPASARAEAPRPGAGTAAPGARAAPPSTASAARQAEAPAAPPTSPPTATHLATAPPPTTTPTPSLAATSLAATSQATATAAAAPATAASPSRLAPKDLETIFLQRAEAAVEQGACERHLLGLEDLAQDAQRSARSEQARVLRARCFERQLRPRQAMNEYRKYLDEYPSGRFGGEAREALGE